MSQQAHYFKIGLFVVGATALAVVGWRLVTQIWFGSGIGLALLLLPDFIRAHRVPIEVPKRESEAAD